MDEEAGERFQELQELRVRHGFARETARRVSAWSRPKLEQDRVTLIADLRKELGESALSVPSQKENEWPKNRELLDLLELRFEVIGFRWDKGSRIDRVVNRQTGATEAWKRHWLIFENCPSVGGQALTLLDMALVPVPLVDGYARKIKLRQDQGHEGEAARQKALMDATGIGYKGLSGVSWLMGVGPVKLPKLVQTMLAATARALFLMFDAVGALVGRDEELMRLLAYRKPGRIPALMAKGRMDFLRPDIVLAVHPETGGYLPVATELESAPAGHGMAHAMQVGYGLPTDTVDAFVRYLGGRKYLVVATNEWAEYVFDQAAFCRALAERGIDARVVFDRSLAEIDARVHSDWQRPSVMDRRLVWDTRFMDRLHKTGLLEYVYGSDRMPEPDALGSGTVVFRFGYEDQLVNTPGLLDRMVAWGNHGATFLNPPWFCLESKTLMAAVHLPSVEAWIRERDPEAIGVLRRCMAETRVLGPRAVSGQAGFADWDELERDRQFWLSKWAAWDGENKSWGSRSLKVGADASDDWFASLEESATLDHPVVVQHVINSALFDVSYVDLDGRVAMMTRGRSRLTPFLMRQPDGEAGLAGSVITLRAHTLRVHGASDAVEAPVVFEDKKEEGLS